MNCFPERIRTSRSPAVRIAAWIVAWFVLVVQTACQKPQLEATWMTNAVLDVDRSVTDTGLGAVQGVVVRDGRVYAYGDVALAQARVGVIREYTEHLETTGRAVWLRRGGKPLICAPHWLDLARSLGNVAGRHDQVRRSNAVQGRDLPAGLGAGLEGRRP